MNTGIQGDAFISDDGIYRHWLSRIWGSDASYALIMGLNPSTADATTNDATIRREIYFTQSWGFDGFFKVNVMDFRSTNPKSLLTVNNPCSEQNLIIIHRMAGRCSKLVVCYGAIHPKLKHYAKNALDVLKTCNKPIWCFGKTQAGYPKHPLYLSNQTQLELFE